MIRSLLVIFALIISSTVWGFRTLETSRIESARVNHLISNQTLIIKVKSLDQFQNQFGYLGDYESFFKTADGTWGYFKLNLLPDAENALLLLNDLSDDTNIAYAYYAPIASNATLTQTWAEDEPTSEPTPSFVEKQFYLDDAPMGVGARKAWNLPGGTGKNVSVIDIETCFQEDHEDFAKPFYIGNNPVCDSNDHGTAVWGEIAAKNDGKGVTGIAYDSRFGIYGFIEGDLADVDDQYIKSINEAIQGAIDNLKAGDVVVIEQQMVGPDLKKYTAVEYWPHIYEQLKKATSKGIICVEAAGNGGSDFDDASYEGAFDLSKRDSGCIMVGAVNPGDMERLGFSNFGNRLDAAGYGKNVATAGYGDLFHGGDARKYTARFSGTSSATPIVAGAVAVVSSIAKEKGLTISPRNMRDALRLTGTRQGPQTSSKRVGSFPVIQELLDILQLK